MVDTVHKAVHSVHDFGHFFTTWWLLPVYLTKPIIKDITKPIYQSKFDKTSSSFINICNSNYKVSTIHLHVFRLTHTFMEVFCYAVNFV